MSYKCEIKERSAQPTLVVRTRTPVQNISQVLGQAYGTVMKYLGELCEQPVGPPYVAYFNMDMQNLDIEAGFPVARQLPGKDSVTASQMPGGKMVACLYTGPYNEIKAGYEALTQWTQEHGFYTLGTAYEVYLNDPAKTPPQQLMTQIMMPLEKGPLNEEQIKHFLEQ